MKRLVLLLLSVCCLAFYTAGGFGYKQSIPKGIHVYPPAFDSNPQLDMVLTNNRPILSVGNPPSCPGNFTICYELSKNSAFPPKETIHYDGIQPQNKTLTEFQVKRGDELSDGIYYWRAKCVDSQGNQSRWIKTRFHVNVNGSRTFSGYMRVPIKRIEGSGAANPKNITDWSDQGLISFWNSTPSGGELFSWIILDMGRPVPISRFWMLSTNKTTLSNGWLTHFVWQYSHDKKKWIDIPGTEVKHNDTYKNIIDFKPVNARYYRLVIRSQNGLQAQLNVVIPYRKGQPAVPKVPSGKYVLIIGNQMNGYTYTDLVKFVERCGYNAVVIPHYEFAYQTFQKLRNKPMAIILSGNNAAWTSLPMFEYYGEFELIRRNYDVPMMGICAGHEFMAMAYGISFVHYMGWSDDTAFRLVGGKRPPCEVKRSKKFKNDPIFEGVPDPFKVVEIHSWAISPLFSKISAIVNFAKPLRPLIYRR